MPGTNTCPAPMGGSSATMPPGHGDGALPERPRPTPAYAPLPLCLQVQRSNELLRRESQARSQGMRSLVEAVNRNLAVTNQMVANGGGGGGGARGGPAGGGALWQAAPLQPPLQPQVPYGVGSGGTRPAQTPRQDVGLEAELAAAVKPSATVNMR